MNLGHFVASPDGTRVAVESDTDAVAVVEVATGGSNWFLPLTRTESVGPFLPGEALKNRPFARFDSESGRVEWVLWNVRTESSRVLNRDWSNKDTSTWIEEQSEKDE